MDNRPVRVLFLCYGNSCRSILAEALARHHWGKKMEAASAGLFPLGRITPHTLTALSEEGIPTEGLYSKGMSDVRMEGIDFIVNLTDLIIYRLIPPSFNGKVISSHVRDPYGEGLESFRTTRDKLTKLVREKLPKRIEAEMKSIHRRDAENAEKTRI